MFDLKRHVMRLRDRQSDEDRGSERGSVIVFVVIALGALIGITAWATETGRVWQVRSQLQAIADTTALAGVGNLLNPPLFDTVDQGNARAAAIALAPQHNILGDPVDLLAGDVEAGSWDLATQVFTELPGSTDPDVVRAVRVVSRRDATVNGEMPTVLGAALGIPSISINSQAIAYWGFAGGGGPGVADLPIAIDCCAITGDTPGAECELNYCETISNTIPNPCPLSAGGTATCLEFHSQGEQNACWTQFDGDSPSINTPELTDIVENGNSEDIEGDIYVDNGDKVPVIKEIRDRFEGRGGYDPAAGDDTNGDGIVDSWVVTLPVVECQNPGDGCAGGDPQEIKGFICFDIHEVLVTPEKIIKGSFVCPTDPRCDNSGLTPGGGLPGGISAQYPVIVN
jgi:type II secretory pathway pseudopilin PulG